MIPGPDLIGSVESTLMDLRSRAVQREGFVQMMQNAREARSEENNTSSSNSSSGSSSNNGNSRGGSSEETINV
jgi:hypothetical protein